MQRFIDGLKVPRDSYDAIVSSGDVTRSLIRERSGERVGHIGPARDLPIFDGLDASLVPIESADYVVCSGLFDDTTETPDDYDDVIATMLARKLPMICANPDIVVERGDQLVYCAGAIADRYAAKGGDVIYAGKPYRPIYEQAMAAARKARGQRHQARPRAGDRRFGAHRSQGRGGVRHRLPVRDRRHPCRGAGRTRQSGCDGALRDVHGRAGRRRSW